MKHKATSDFWYHYRQLPKHIQNLADKCFNKLKQDPYYPSSVQWTVKAPVTASLTR